MRSGFFQQLKMIRFFVMAGTRPGRTAFTMNFHSMLF